MDNADKDVTYDVLIIGGGVTGTAVLSMLSAYTNVRRIAFIEKEERVAQVNSNPRNNSQTLHFGDIETNFSLEKALRVKEAAEMLVRYMEQRTSQGQHEHEPLYRKTHKMVLAVGAREVAELEERYRAFRNEYPKLKRLERNDIAALEPKIVEGRDPTEPILALASEDGYAVNYQKLAEAFLEDASIINDEADVFFGTQVKAITHEATGYCVETDKGTFYARAVVVAAGPYSLRFAQVLGYGRELAILPVAGGFYFVKKKVLNGKVYMVQFEKFAFARTHGDPDVTNEQETRFGPTAKPVALWERRRYRTFFDFIRSRIVSIAGLVSVLWLLRDPALISFLAKNLLYEAPLIGKWFFLQEVRKIVPSLRYSDLQFGRDLGGIRPQIVDLKTRQLQMGEAKIIGDNIIFNTTPSPGASMCLKNAEHDALYDVEFLGEGFHFDHEKFKQDFGRNASNS